MIDVEVWFYVESESRTIRFMRNVNISSPPFIGVEIEVKEDHLTISQVIFKDGGGIVCIADNDQSPAKRIYPDSEIDDVIEDMKECGWDVLSDIKRRRKKSIR
ncbi:MAG: hypothetical protein WBK44_04455 [Smithellaceae bacterium]|jgi:hypothetical protein|nr:MAG: hypothetical protein BWY90_00100 [Deltaproteobacteria bacterium ADurb.BinA014]HOF77240.1 hypothetical protein [Smithellaceae bacterium]HOS08352.1 hypothetical protein [Smithellaceae bacterium]HOU03719.1 hypothetical protein [Smithellaceae bacterium]HOZ61610.1 hypothetical protein [Smithellaceae bacterium]